MLPVYFLSLGQYGDVILTLLATSSSYSLASSRVASMLIVD